MTGSLWHEAFLLATTRRRGLYDQVAHERWRACIRRVIGDCAPGVVLKTDAWNEALGSPTSLLPETSPGLSVVLLDVSAGILKLAPAVTHRVVGDIRQLPLRPGQLSCILDVSTSDHCSTADLPAVVRGYAAALRPGGWLLLIHNSSRSLPWRLLRNRGRYSPVYDGWPPAYYFDPDDVARMVESSGFLITSRRWTNCFAWMAGLLNWLPPVPAQIAGRIGSLELHQELRSLGWLARQHVLLAVRRSS